MSSKLEPIDLDEDLFNEFTGDGIIELTTPPIDLEPVEDIKEQCKPVQDVLPLASIHSLPQQPENPELSIKKIAQIRSQIDDLRFSLNNLVRSFQGIIKFFKSSILEMMGERIVFHMYIFI